ncbi:MAG: hypothetical protein U0636_00060 [Phycisphaerales bacterium]
MTSGGEPQLSNPFSAGGGGARFENQVQASFAALMLAGGFAPCLPCRPIQKLVLQRQPDGPLTDDLSVFTTDADGSKPYKLLAQVRHSISVTEGNEAFGKAIKGAWADFNNSAVFTRGRDALALISGPLSATDINDARTILEWARTSGSATEFFDKVRAAQFSSAEKQQKLKAFRTHACRAAGREISEEELFEFLRHFHLLGYDLDVRSGTMHALLHSVIGRDSPESASGIWAQIALEVATFNQNGGTVTVDSFSEDVRAAFKRTAPETMPAAFSQTPAPANATSWSSADVAPALVVANLLGRWDESSNADMAAAASVAQDETSKWLQKMREVLQFPDAPVTHRSGVWAVKHREELWQVLGSRLFDHHLTELRKCAVSVLTERDPQFSLPPDNRFAAPLSGHVLRHSKNLRRGLAESLALLSGQPQALTNCSRGTVESAAALAVREILRDADWMLWASVNDVLPPLAEASPREFMDSVEHALSVDPCPFDTLYSQEGSGIGGRNYLTGLLWALETLAWDEQHLVRATVLLGALADRDPGGQWANRPSTSLTTIFLPWLPQTMASKEKRKVAVETLVKEHPTAGWSLLLSLLPNQTTMSSGTQKPRWRGTIPEGAPARPDREQYREEVGIYAGLAVRIAATDQQKLVQLAQYLDCLPDADRATMLKHIGSDAVKSLPEEGRISLWESLCSMARKHRSFADAHWALPDDQVSAIEGAADSIAPHRPENTSRVLFTEDDWELTDPNANFEEEQSKLWDRRRDALRGILAAKGVEGVIALAEVVESPDKLGFALGSLDAGHLAAPIVPAMLRGPESALRRFAQGVARGSFAKEGWTRIDAIDKSTWPQDALARLLVSLPFSAETWNRVGSLLKEGADEYWRSVAVFPYQAEAGDYTAVEALIKHGRPWAAIDCLASILRAGQPIDMKRAAQALLAGASSDGPINPMQALHAVNIIQALQDDSNTDPADIAKVEWALFPLINDSDRATPKFLESRIATDPEFFCELVKAAFRDESGDTNVAELSEAQKSRALNAYRLLQTWKTVPGSTSEGGLSGAAFATWIDKVTQSLGSCGRLRVGLHLAGGVLVNSPADPDGLWMHRAIAGVLDRADMAELRIGYGIGIHNLRGAHYEDPEGKPEIELSRRYSLQAEEIENAGFHRVAGTLREIASDYTREAEDLRKRYGSRDLGTEE